MGDHRPQISSQRWHLGTQSAPPHHPTPKKSPSPPHSFCPLLSPFLPPLLSMCEEGFIPVEIDGSIYCCHLVTTAASNASASAAASAAALPLSLSLPFLFLVVCCSLLSLSLSRSLVCSTWGIGILPSLYFFPFLFLHFFALSPVCFGSSKLETGQASEIEKGKRPPASSPEA